ncbi:hypothetical protein FG379_002236 [Cryptosporidium bovis]|uniref:uncharacterized protein n=1 Tax=Cryptosporidium bovis TaxID=310047 RepID=UPI00351A02F7|nr:hypothetical protein FG379_002236 [Cryptosporidium bovis]
MSDSSEPYNIEKFNKLRGSSITRINNAINSSRSILESARKCSNNTPNSYKILSVIPGAVEAPKRDLHVTDDLCVAISKKYSSKLESILDEKEKKNKEIEIKSGINGMIEDWNILESGNNNAGMNGSNNVNENNKSLDSTQFKDFVTEAKAAEFVIRFLDRMQSKKFEMNYENVSLHVKGETQLEKQLSAYPSFVSAISHASSGLSVIKRDLLYDQIGNRGGSDSIIDGSSSSTVIGNYRNKQIFDRNPLLQLSLELERDITKERAQAWTSKYFPSIGTKLNYETMDEEKALGIYEKDKHNKDAILFRQFKLQPSAGIKGIRYSNNLTGETVTTLGINSIKDDISVSDDCSSTNNLRSKRNQTVNGLQLAFDVNKIPLKFPWLLEQLPTSQLFKSQVLLLNENLSANNDNAKEEKVKKSFYQKAKSLATSSSYRQDNVIKAIVNNRGVAMVRNISMVPADSNLEAYFDELDDNSDNDDRYLWDDDYERRNCKTKEEGVQKYMEETSYDIRKSNDESDIDELMNELELKYRDLTNKRDQNANGRTNTSGVNNGTYIQGYSQTRGYMDSSDTRDYRDVQTLTMGSGSNISKVQNSLPGSFGQSMSNEREILDVNTYSSVNNSLNEYNSNPKVRIEYDLSELFDTNNVIYKGEGIEKTWRAYYESLKGFNEAVLKRKKHMEEIHYNINPSLNRLNGSQSRKSRIPKSFLPIHEYIMQEEDPQEEYYKFIQGQRMIKESLNGFPLQDSQYLRRTNELLNLKGEEHSSEQIDNNNRLKIVGKDSKGHVRGLMAVRGGRRIINRLNRSLMSEYEKRLRSRIEDVGFLEYNEEDRIRFLNNVRTVNVNKITKLKEMENKLGTKARISCRGRIKRMNGKV